MLYNPDDVIRIRHAGHKDNGWRIVREVHSIDKSMRLFRIQLLDDNGNDYPKVGQITIGDYLIIEKLGRYPEWHKQTGNKN